MSWLRRNRHRAGVGLIARADDRGLGHMTWEFSRHVEPDRVLIIDFGAGSRFPNRFDRYPDDALIVRWNPDTGLVADVDGVREWLDGLDVVYSAETFYDWRIVDWCRELGVATVLHVMPELLATTLPAEPDHVWTPTAWRLENLPERTVVVPVPVATSRFATSDEDRAPGPLRVLHVAGRRAMADRNGTTLLLRALRHVEKPMHVTITTQDSAVPAATGMRHQVRLETSRTESVSEYWRLYDGFDVLVMPRKYGGLCLPVQEAAAAGLAIVMTDCPPNDEYPAWLVPAKVSGSIETAAGTIPLFDCDEWKLATVLDELASSRFDLDTARQAAVDWSCGRSWDALLPIYRERLSEAVRGTQGVDASS